MNTLLRPEQAAKEIAESILEQPPEVQKAIIQWLQTVLGGFPLEDDE